MSCHKSRTDPEIILVAWRGSASQLAARLKMRPADLLLELQRLPGGKHQVETGRLHFEMDMPRAIGRLQVLIERRKLGEVD